MEPMPRDGGHPQLGSDWVCVIRPHTSLFALGLFEATIESVSRGLFRLGSSQMDLNLFQYIEFIPLQIAKENVSQHRLTTNPATFQRAYA